MTLQLKQVGGSNSNHHLTDKDACKYHKQKRYWKKKTGFTLLCLVRGTPFLYLMQLPRGRPPPRTCPEFLAAWLRWSDWRPLGQLLPKRWLIQEHLLWSWTSQALPTLCLLSSGLGTPTPGAKPLGLLSCPAWSLGTILFCTWVLRHAIHTSLSPALVGWRSVWKKSG